MYFFRACVANHAHDLPAGGAAHDGVVDQHDALAFEHSCGRDSVLVSRRSRERFAGLDESAAHVVIANESETKRNAALGGVSYCCSHPESGTGTTRSASTGASRASCLPRPSRLAGTERPKTRLSGREKYTCSKMQLDCAEWGVKARSNPFGPTITNSPGLTSRSYSAPIRSKALVSEANTIASCFSPSTRRIFPSPAGGSRADRVLRRSDRG